MREMHCHILPEVDDGAHNLQESLEMLEAAKQVGITSIVCTPHCRDPYFDFDAMWEAFRLLEQHANGFPLTMGFEVNHAKLMDLGIEWAPKLTFQRSNEFLLELSTRATEYHFREYESTIYQLQSVGLDVIIAHPERYKAIQENVEIAYNLVEMGCKLQASADFIVGGRTGAEKKPAKRLFEENLYTYIASDAHNVATTASTNKQGKNSEPAANMPACSASSRWSNGDWLFWQERKSISWKRQASFSGLQQQRMRQKCQSPLDHPHTTNALKKAVKGRYGSLPSSHLA